MNIERLQGGFIGKTGGSPPDADRYALTRGMKLCICLVEGGASGGGMCCLIESGKLWVCGLATVPTIKTIF